MTDPRKHVRVWQQPDDLWRWRYVEPGPDGEMVLNAHRTYDSRDEARASAQAAFPHVAVQVVEPPQGLAPAERVPRWLVFVLLVLLVILRRRAPRGAPEQR